MEIDRTEWCCSHEKQAKRTRSYRLHHLTEFADEETGQVNDPLHSQETLDQPTERKKRERNNLSKKAKPFKTFAIQLEEGSKEKKCWHKGRCNMCYVYQKPELGTVQDISNQICDEKSKYLSTKKLYYGCLKPIFKTHTARNSNQS